jgi:transcriptional regulator
MLYNPPAHREQDLATLHAHIAATGLATLVTVGDDGPLVSHLPLLLDPAAGRHGELTGHLARANPQWRTSDLRKPALAIFMGPDAYVSPSWYPAKQEHGRVVPTWNYSTVHARGTLEFFHEPERLAALVTRLTDRYESRFAAPWKVTDAPAGYLQKQLHAIVGFVLKIESLDGKLKLSQNRSLADRRGVVAGLRASERAADQSTADEVERHIGPSAAVRQNS